MQRVSLLWYRSKLSRYLSPYAAALVVLAFVSGVVLLRRPSLATTVVALSTSAHPSAPPATVVKRPLHIYRLQSIDYIALEFASWVEYLEGMGRPLVWHVETDLLVEDALVMGEDPKVLIASHALAAHSPARSLWWRRWQRRASTTWDSSSTRMSAGSRMPTSTTRDSLTCCAPTICQSCTNSGAHSLLSFPRAPTISFGPRP